MSRWFALVGLIALCGLFAGRAQAAALLSGAVVAADGRPSARATVTVSGNNVRLSVVTDGAGRFAFPTLAPGTYVLEARAATGETGALRVDLTGDGAAVVLQVGLRQIGSVTSTNSARVRGSGSDVFLNNTTFTRSPYSDSFPEALIQLPGGVRGANGVVHFNGDHGVINYVVDGVSLPQALNREVGSEIDPNDVSFVDALEGAYPAQYGLRFGSVINLTTKAGTGPAGFTEDLHAGSYASVDQTLGYHGPLPGGGGFSVAVRTQQTARGLDPPNFGSPHNRASNTNEFVRVTLPHGGTNFTELTLIHSYRSYQIPNDVDNGEPATADDNEKQNDTFFSLQVHQAIGGNGSLTYGPAIKISRIRDFGDPANDFTYGEALNIANGGSPTDCATAVESGNFGPTTCAFSLTDDKTAVDYIAQAEYVRPYGHHEFRAGVTYDRTRVAKKYALTLQPGNFLAPILTPGAPDAPITVVDNNPNSGNTYETYAQDSWRLSNRYELDYGLRYDFFTISSTNFSQGFGAFSPRLKLTRFFGSRGSLYAYMGRWFEPFSFENVDPKAAQLLNLPLQPTPAQFDLRPERDTVLEFGGHMPVGSGSLGFRIWQRNATDLIDDTQVGVTLLHQDINYSLGRASQQAIDYVEPLTRGGRVYFSVAHTIALNNGCETQLLAPCFGAPTGYTPADHDQRYSVAGGVLLNDRRGGWLSADLEYGSGLSSGSCPVGTPGYCKRTPHTILAVEKGIALAPRLALTLRVQNLLNDRYFVTLLNAQGNHYAPPRQFDIGLRFGGP